VFFGAASGTIARTAEAVAYLRVTFEVSERQSCSVLGIDQTSTPYGDRGPTMQRCAVLARLRRFGYRRLQGIQYSVILQVEFPEYNIVDPSGLLSA
jgi:hypothetical protein